MPTLAFWNTAGNVEPATVAALAHESDADVLILAENEMSNDRLVPALNSGVDRYYFPDMLPPDRLTIFSRFLSDKSTVVDDYDRVSIRQYRPPLGDSFLVVAVHLSSKLWKKTEDQSLGSTRIARYIREAEQKVGHERTIVIGDLNMNPFETGVVGSEGLHAIMDRNIAAVGSRIVSGESCAFFYNPMWSFFGDRGSTPPGTYYRNSGTEVNYFWHLFDQVLVRPALIKCLSKDSIEIVTEISGMTLLTDAGRPDGKLYSDHLPVICRLSYAQEVANG